MALAQHETDETDTRLRFAVGAFAVMAALIGMVLVARMTTADPAIALQTEARSGELSVWVDRYEWLSHEHGNHDHGDDAEAAEEGDSAQAAIDDVTSQSEGFAMPASMMPGTPNEGFQRVQFELNILNRGGLDADVHPDDFRLEAANGDSWLSLRGGTFSPTTLPPQYAVATIVAFDVPEESSGDSMHLVWTSAEGESRFALEGSGHDHG